MDYKHLIAGALAFSLAACTASCSSKNSSDSASAGSTEKTDSADVTGTTRTPPVPDKASDPNAVTFDDGDFSFARLITDDKKSASGELVIAEVQGNKMLRLKDDMKVGQEGKVQKIAIHAAPLIGQENLGKVRKITFDAYADAKAANYLNQDGELVQVPGTICGGGGTVVALKDKDGKGKWCDFSEFQGGEYDFDFSGAVHGEFKFLLADTGECWDATMDDANFLIMRWGIENDSDLYIDNIVFYDENGKSIPIIKDELAAAAATATTAVTETATASETTSASGTTSE